MNNKSPQSSKVTDGITAGLGTLCALIVQSLPIDASYKTWIMAAIVPLLTVFINTLVVQYKSSIITKRKTSKKNEDIAFIINCMNDNNLSEEKRAEVKKFYEEIIINEIKNKFESIEKTNKMISQLDKSFIENFEDVSK